MEFDQGSNVRDRPLTATLVDTSASDRSEAATNASTLVSPTFAEPSEEKIGGRVGRYWLRKELGAGGMGVVYEGYDPDLERPVAVKLLHAAFDRERLSREARALAKVSHPNVVAVFDVGTFGARAFIAMELVDGVTLRAWIAERARSLEEILDVAMQAGRGLAAAHAAGLLHRDFKPDNVMVGRDGRVRVLDFGIVRAFDESAAATSAEAKDEPKSIRVFTFSDGCSSISGSRRGACCARRSGAVRSRWAWRCLARQRRERCWQVSLARASLSAQRGPGLLGLARARGARRWQPLSALP